jgi:translation initiation factor IF-2
MAKIRVHELAKELGLQSREMVDTLQSMGLDVKNHMSTLEESQARWVKKQLEAKTGDQQRRPEPVKKDNKVIEKSEDGKQIPKPPQHSAKDQANRAEGQQAQKEHRGTPKPGYSQGKPTKSNERIPSQDKRSSLSQENKSQERFRGEQKPVQRPQDREQAKSQPKPAADRFQHRDSRRDVSPKPGGDRTHQRDNTGDNRGLKKPTPPPVGQRKELLQMGERTATTTPDRRHEPIKKAMMDKAKEARPGQPGKYDKNKGARKNAPVQLQRDYTRPGKKHKHKRKKEDILVQLPDKISLEESTTVRELAEKLHRSSAEIVKKLMELGTMASINQAIDFDTAEIVASLYEVKVERVISEEEKLLEEIIDDETSLKPRPPVVTVMGHVDHGKTSLLDRIRKSDVVSGEAGGITQHIGAYQVTVNDNRITFIDTPGHEAFTAMRARGANLTDIVVLVVAADDGVMPQTVEAINHIKAAGVPFVVAINKIDKPEANPDRVMQQLTEYGILAEEWGGDTIFVPVSAKQGQGIDTLLEMILLVAEMHEIKANPDRAAEGVVIEGQLDRGRGPVATVLVLKGTLRIGDFLVCGNNYCKVRAMTDHKGRRVDKAYPSMPVEITGWSDVPEAGGKVLACDEKVAKEIVNLRLSEKKIEEQKQSSKVSLDDFFKQMQDADIKELNLIIKGDVQGSIEALAQSLLRLATNEVKVNVIHSAVGAISETDVMLASASQAIIIGFNVRPDVKARKYAEDEGIDVRLYRVIYEAIDDVKKAMAGLLDPEYKEKYMGRAEVRATFKVPNVGLIAGSYVIDGKLQRNANVRVLRDGVIVYEGRLSSLKRFKDDVREVVENYECGIGIQDFNDVKEGDIIEAYTLEEIPREL